MNDSNTQNVPEPKKLTGYAAVLQELTTLKRRQDAIVAAFEKYKAETDAKIEVLTNAPRSDTAERSVLSMMHGAHKED